MGPEQDPSCVRVWAAGCFDLVHFGHANLLRQVKALGQHLVVGVHTDEDIAHQKGAPPVFNQEERYALIRSIKWVDQIVEGAPYITTIETLDRYNCTFCVHATDISVTADGLDANGALKDTGRYREVPRTEGVSSTDLIHRMLTPHVKVNSEMLTGSQSTFTTSQRIAQFSSPTLKLASGSKIVYTAGAFDVFHLGHLTFLEKAKSLGDVLIVGVYPDSIVRMGKGSTHPIMSSHERVLSVLACKYVANVVIGAPYVVTEELVNQLNVSLVVHGKDSLKFAKMDPNKVPKQKGIFAGVESDCDVTTEKIIDRIISKSKEYEERNNLKAQKELQMSTNVKLI